MPFICIFIKLNQVDVHPSLLGESPGFDLLEILWLFLWSAVRKRNSTETGCRLKTIEEDKKNAGISNSSWFNFLKHVSCCGLLLLCISLWDWLVCVQRHGASQDWPNWRLFACLGERINDGGNRKIKQMKGAGGLHLDHSCTQCDSHTPTLTKRHTHTCVFKGTFGTVQDYKSLQHPK